MNPFEVETKKKDTLQSLINKIEKLEIAIQKKKKEEEQLKEFKQLLVDEVEKRHLIKFSWVTPNETKFTYVGATEPKEEVKREFCEGLFKQDYPELYEKYCKDFTDVKSGRKSYVRVTLPKE